MAIRVLHNDLDLVQRGDILAILVFERADSEEIVRNLKARFRPTTIRVNENSGKVMNEKISDRHEIQWQVVESFINSLPDKLDEYGWKELSNWLGLAKVSMTSPSLTQKNLPVG